jgi:hypothetical protein
LSVWESEVTVEPPVESMVEDDTEVGVALTDGDGEVT